jgi:hypothetical protein
VSSVLLPQHLVGAVRVHERASGELGKVLETVATVADELIEQVRREALVLQVWQMLNRSALGSRG